MPTTKIRLAGSQVDSRGFPPRPGTRLGDRIIFTDDIIQINGASNPGPSSPSPPQHSGFCILVREPDIWLCQAGFILPGIPNTPFPNGGQIQGRGLMDFHGGAFTAAITGGTDDYHHAEGQISGQVSGSTTPSRTDWTLTIETP